MRCKSEKFSFSEISVDGGGSTSLSSQIGSEISIHPMLELFRQQMPESYEDKNSFQLDRVVQRQTSGSLEMDKRNYLLWDVGMETGE